MNSRLLVPGMALLLLLSIAGAMAPLLSGPAEFIADDHYFIVDNPRVTDLTVQSFAEIWRKPMRLEYFPVTISSYAVEYALWGANVKLFRVTNLLLFWGIGLVAWSVAVRLGADDSDGRTRTGGYAAAFLAMTIMLFHPVNVESVAAISHRKELLYVLFGLLAFRCYVTPARSIGTTVGALAFMALAQLSKGSGVIVPLLFVTYELFQDRDPRPLRQRLSRLVPFVLLSAVIFVIQFLVAFRSGVVATEPIASFAMRIGGIVRTFSFMLEKLLVPVNLTFDYDIVWPTRVPIAELVLPALLLGVLLHLAWTRRKRYLMFGLLALVPLAPYMQIVPLAHNLPGQIVFYDHYLLFTTVLLAIPLTRVLVSLSDRLQKQLVAIPIVIAICWLAYDHHLAGFWQTRETLYKRVIATSPLLPKGYLFLGRAYLETERYEEAKQVLNRVFGSKQWNPTFAEVYQALGDAHAFSGSYPEAERNYRTYLRYKPDDLKSLQNLSSTLIQMRRLPEAKDVLSILLRHYPADPIGRNNLALVAQQQKATP